MSSTLTTQLIDGLVSDMTSFANFMYKPADFMVQRRLAPPVNTLNFYIDLFSKVASDGASDINQAIINSGFITVDSFEVGATITQRNQALRHAVDGKLYRWAGDLPKVVPTDSTPANSGGIAANAWLEVSDTVIRQELASPQGSNLLGDGSATQKQINLYGGKKYEPIQGGYPLHAKVILENGIVVKSIIEGNTQDPNLALTGWSIQDRHRNITDYVGVDTTGVTSSTAAMQAYVNDVNTQRLSRLYMPTVHESYLINSPVLFDYPIGIVGDTAPNQNRYLRKLGNILIGPDTPYALNFGNGRSTYPEVTRIADQWLVKNIGFAQQEGSHTKTAILWDVRNDGPDRGCLLKEVSANNLDKVFHLTHGASTDLANLIIENCCMSNNAYVVYSEGALNSVRIASSQIEQSTEGILHGAFNGPISVVDCMIEGTKNSFNIQAVPDTGSRTKFNLERCYVEHNYGEYLINFATTVAGAVTIKDNFFFDINHLEANNQLTDVVRLSGTIDHIDNADNFNVTLDKTFDINAFPNFSKFGNYAVRVAAPFNHTFKNIVTSPEFDKLRVVEGIVPSSVLPAVDTNKGKLLYVAKFGGPRVSLPTDITANKIYTVTFAYYDEYAGDLVNSPTGVNINDNGLSVGTSGGMNIEACRGKVKVASFTFIANFNAVGGCKVSLSASALGESFILNCMVEEIGVYTEPETKVKTSLAMPRLLHKDVGVTYRFPLQGASGISVPSLGDAVKNISLSGITDTHRIEVWLDGHYPQITCKIETIYETVVSIRFYNSSETIVTLTADTLNIKVT